MRFCCMPLDSAGPHNTACAVPPSRVESSLLKRPIAPEVEAWPPKSDICPGRLRHSSPWRRERRGESGGIHESAVVLLVNG
jgi:hypothetical protein